MLRLLRRLLASLSGRSSSALGGPLAQERKGELFSWFHLEARAAPVAQADGLTLHSFHPEGSAFQELARLDVLTDRGDAIVETQLALARDFIEDRRNSPFARDIAKSYLAWALKNEPGRRGANALIDNIANLGAAGAPVLVRAEAAPPAEDTTGGYAVFLGERSEAVVPLTRTRVLLRNSAQSNGAGARRWLTVAVSLMPPA